MPYERHKLFRTRDDRRLVKDIGRVFEAALQFTGYDHHEQRQVELAGAGAHGGGMHNDPAQRHAREGLLEECEQDPEERLSAGRPTTGGNLHDLLERQVDVLDGSMECIANSADDVAKATRTEARVITARLVLPAQPDRQRVQKKPDLGLSIRTTSISDRRADDDVVVAADPVEPGMAGGQHDGEERHILLRRQSPETSNRFCVDRETLPGTAAGRHGWPQRVSQPTRSARRIAEFLPPEFSMPRQHRLRRHHRRERQRRRNGVPTSRLPAVIHRIHGELRQFLEDHSQRPVIDDTVVKHEEQDAVALMGILDQNHPPERGQPEIERPPRFGTQHLRDRLFPLDALGTEQRGFRPGDVNGSRCGDPLHEAIVSHHQRGTEGWMPIHDRADRSADPTPIDGGGRPEHERLVVGRRIRREPVRQKHALLRRRGRHVARAVGRDRNRRVARLRNSWRGHRLLPQDRRRSDECRQARDGAPLEQLAQRQFHAPYLANRRHQFHRHERFAAAVKEVVVHPDGIDTQQVAPDAGQLLLQRRPRHHARDVRGPLQVGNRQRTAIDLAARIQRQRLQTDECGGHHEIRQRLREAVANGIIRNAARYLRYVCDKTGITGLHFVGSDGGLANAGHRHQRRLDLAELDAVTADLDLIVDPSVEDEHAIRPPAAQITRAVQPPARRGVELIRHKSLRRQFGTVEIAPGQPGSADVQLPHDSVRQRLPPPVEHVRRRAGDRHTDRNLVSHLTVAYIDPGRNDRRLGGAVGVE